MPWNISTQQKMDFLLSIVKVAKSQKFLQTDRVGLSSDYPGWSVFAGLNYPMVPFLADKFSGENNLFYCNST